MVASIPQESCCPLPVPSLKSMRNASLSAGINLKTSPSAKFKDCLPKWAEED